MSMRANRTAYLLLLAFIGALMLALNAHTPLMMDDYDYSFSWSTGMPLAGIGDILASQAAHYRLWGGRSVTHFLAQLFLYWGKPAFNLANCLMYALLLLEIDALSRPKGTAWHWRALLAAHALLFACVEFFGVAFLWLDGACNYLWGTALALVPLLIARSEREGGFFDRESLFCWLALPLCFLAGWTNENTACGVLGALVLLLGWDIVRKRKIRLWRVAALAAQALGVAVMLLAPGNFARAAEGSSRTLVAELVYRAAVVCYCMLRYAGVPVLLTGLSLFAAAKRKAPLRVEWLCVLAGSALLSAGALVGSPQISDRSFTAVIVLIVAALLAVMADMKPSADRRSLRVGMALTLLCAALGVHAYFAVCAHEQAWHVQVSAIESAAAAGLEEVTIDSIPSSSRYTMSISLQEDPAVWPNSTLGKVYGIRIVGR